VGKTAFVERLLDADMGTAVCVRAHRDARLARARATKPQRDKELRRYREAGALAAAVYRFPEPLDGGVQARTLGRMSMVVMRCAAVRGERPGQCPALLAPGAPIRARDGAGTGASRSPSGRS
jgi:hypothetical protein